jgi:hypothetical protein
MLAALDDEPGPLARATARVFLRGCGHLHDAADQSLAPLQCHQRTQQRCGVQTVGLGPACPAVHQQAGRVQHPVLDAAGTQPAMQPEAVIACLEAAHDAYRPAQLPLCLPPLASDQRKQAVSVTALKPMLADLVGHRRVQRDQPRRAAQFQRQEQRWNCRLRERWRSSSCIHKGPPSPDVRTGAY